MRNRTLVHWQKRVFALCWLAYTFAYLGRLNLSIAIPLIGDSLSLDKTNLGLIGSAFFWAYAFGQLINGRLGDKFKSRGFVFLGLMIPAIANLLFGYSTNYIFMILLWTLNGYFQSMLWGPLLKTINLWFPKKQSSKLAIYMGLTVISGFILVWGGLGWISSYTGWKGIFLIPGVILLVYSVFWYTFIRNSPEEIGLKIPEKEISTTEIEIDHENLGFDDNNKQKHISFVELIFNTRLYLIAFAGIPLGFVREGIGLWAPTILLENFQLSFKSTAGAALIIPFFNLMGIVAVRLLCTKFYNKEIKLASIFFSGGILACILLYFIGSLSVVVSLFLLAICSLCFYAVTSIFTSVIPQKYHLTSSVAGFLDFSIYLGAGLSGIVTGFILDKLGWNVIILLWIVMGIAGSVCIYLRQIKRLNKRCNEILVCDNNVNN
jgi:sugar phosphate permease